MLFTKNGEMSCDPVISDTWLRKPEHRAAVFNAMLLSQGDAKGLLSIY